MKKLIDRLLTWIIFNLGYLLSTLYWKVGNKITIIGQLPKTGPLIIITSHQLFTDSFLLGCALDSWQTALTKPGSTLWHCPASNWLKNPIIGWCIRHTHCLPINRATGRGHDLIKAVLRKNGRISIFPTSGFQANGANQHRVPVLLGKLIYETRPAIIPVRITGLPAWDGRQISQTKGWLEKLRLFRQRTCPGLRLSITIAIGEPLDLSALYQLENSRDTWRQIAEQLINNVS